MNADCVGGVTSSSRRGAFILFEGLDRSGKSTQAKLLVDRLLDEGLSASLYKFPDRTTPVGKIIDQYLTNLGEYSLPLQTLHLLFSANRWELADKIKADIAAGTHVVVDRYIFSGIAFSAAQGLDLKWCSAPDRGLPAPDCVLFMDISSRAAQARGGYGDEIYEREEIQKNVCEQYQQLKATQANWIVVNAERDVQSIQDDVFKLAQDTMHRVADSELGIIDF